MTYGGKPNDTTSEQADHSLPARERMVSGHIQGENEMTYSTLTTVADIVELPPGSLVTHVEYPAAGVAKEVVLRKWDGGYGPRPNAWHVADAGEHHPRALTEADLPVTLLRRGRIPGDTTSEQGDHKPAHHVHDGYTLYDGVCKDCDPTTAMDLSGWTRSPGVRLAVDAKGYVWRFYPAGSVLGTGSPLAAVGAVSDTWSMAPTNPDNFSIPQPVTWYEPEQQPGREANRDPSQP